MPGDPAVPIDAPQHLDLPVRLLPDGTFAMHTQGSDRETEQQVHLVARTQAGNRTGRPEFGVPDATFQLEVSKDDLAARLEQQVPGARATVTGNPRPVEHATWLRVNQARETETADA